MATTATPQPVSQPQALAGPRATLFLWIFQGVTLAALLGATYALSAKLARIETRLETSLGAIERIDATLIDPNNGVVARLARLEERTANTQRVVESLSQRSR